MLVSPESYKNENENKTLEQLVLERTKLFNAIVEYEKKHIIGNEPVEVSNPSPKDIYYSHNLYLKEVTDLIIKGNGFKDADAKHIEELIKLEKRLFNKNGFYLEIRSGSVLPILHPHYYDGRVDIILDNHFGKINCSAKIGKREYSVNEEQFNKIKQIIKEKLELLYEIAEKQSDEIYEGSYNNMLIKFNSILLNVSFNNINSEKDYNILSQLKNTIFNIIIPKNEENIETVVNELVNKIITLPIGTETSISNLLSYKIDEFSDNQLFEINKRVLNICKEKGVVLNFDKYKNQVVGLPFNISFVVSEKLKNLESNKFEFYKKNDVDKIWWVDNKEQVGEHLFSFDKKKIYNLFKDYPYELSNEEKEIFDKENPYWADFFKDRKKIENNNPNSIKESNSDKIKNGYTYSFDDYKRLFEKDNDSFIRLIIPSDFLKMILDTNNSEDMNLIGKKNLDFSTDEVIVLKKYAGYVYDHILDPNGQKDIDRTIYVLVDVIEHLPKGTEISISQILGKNFSKYDTNELFEINKKVLGICKEKGIEFNFDKYKDQEVGLPFNIPFIIE